MAMTSLEIPADQALFDGTLVGVVAPFYENERPVRGLAGRLDWRLGGVISRGLLRGVLTGRPGECAYLPVNFHGRVHHLILVGGGFLSRYGKRGLIPDESFASLRKNLETLKLEKVALSRADFGGLTDEYLEKQLGKAAPWIAP
jgi:hypothetical protein